MLIQSRASYTAVNFVKQNKSSLKEDPYRLEKN